MFYSLFAVKVIQIDLRAFCHIRSVEATIFLSNVFNCKAIQIPFFQQCSSWITLQKLLFLVYQEASMKKSPGGNCPCDNKNWFSWIEQKPHSLGMRGLLKCAPPGRLKPIVSEELQSWPYSRLEDVRFNTFNLAPLISGKHILKHKGYFCRSTQRKLGAFLKESVLVSADSTTYEFYICFCRKCPMSVHGDMLIVYF